jgi:alkanesulfonate monooxygenase
MIMMMKQPKLRMGWFIPTLGDTTAFGVPEKAIPQSLDHFLQVATAAESAGFEYALVPINPYCWDAWVVSSFVAAHTTSLKLLLALKPGFIHPVAQAKMISAFDQMTNGRIAINLIIGSSAKDAVAEGQIGPKEDRYRQLEEEVMLLKRLWTEEAVVHEGEFHRTNAPMIVPKPYQSPYPEFFLGGGSDQAADISARHSSVHLFWGDYPEKIRDEIKSMLARADAFGRRDDIEFAMRLQVICRENERDAWDFADQLIANADAQWKETVKNMAEDSVAQKRVRDIAKDAGRLLTPHLWTGITEVRPGAGIAVVGNPEQVARQLADFLDAGCSGFCLSGYPHHEEATRFGELVMPLLTKHYAEQA